VVYGEEFRESIVPLLILLPGVVAFSLVNVLASYLAGVGKPRLNMAISVASLCVTVAAGFTLIPVLGAVGAAMVSTLSYLTGTVLTVRVFAKLSRTAVRDVVLPTAGDFALSMALARSVLNRVRFGLNAERA
jgi:O-antigen/teichoic acid export membrane protein